MDNYPFWVSNFNRVSNYTDQYPELHTIFQQPVAFWYGAKRGQKSIDSLAHSIKRLLARANPAVPYFVLYNMPDRDLGQYSKGGAHSKEQYLHFIEEFCAGIKGTQPIVIFEPDAIPHATVLSQQQQRDRLLLMRTALKTLTDNTSAKVYVDVGHSNWLDAETVHNMLSEVWNSRLRGFSVNVSNFRSTAESMRWADEICEYNSDYRYVIDTSRNGNGPYGNNWCNPPGRALGQTPTCNTGNTNCDAFLWIKIPGESDGKSAGGPKAGKFWPEYALDLIQNARGIS